MIKLKLHFRTYTSQLIVFHSFFTLYIFLNFISYLHESNLIQINILQNISDKSSKKIDEIIITSQKLVKKSLHWTSFKEVSKDLNDIIPKSMKSINSVEWIDSNGNTINRYGEAYKQEVEKLSSIPRVNVLNNGDLYVLSSAKDGDHFVGNIRIILDTRALLNEIIDINSNYLASYKICRFDDHPISSLLSDLLFKDEITYKTVLNDYKLIASSSIKKFSFLKEYISKKTYEIILLYLTTLLLMIYVVKIKEKENKLIKILRNHKGNQADIIKHLKLERNYLTLQEKHLQYKKSSHLKSKFLNQIYSKFCSDLFIKLSGYDESMLSGGNNEILPISVIKNNFYTSENLNLNSSEINVLDCIRKAQTMLYLDRAELQLDINKSYDIPNIYSDESFFTLIILNILRMVSDDLPEDGIIKISFMIDDDNIRFFIESNGFGYEPFSSSETSKTDKDITVLNIDALKNLCRQLGISLDVTKIPYEGTKFSLQAPSCVVRASRIKEQDASGNVYIFKKK